MANTPSSPVDQHPQASNVANLPPDELLRYGRSLGLELQDHEKEEDLRRRVPERVQLLAELDRDALLDIVIWARRPVRKSATKEELAREIVRVQSTKYQKLSRRGLIALAKLRDIRVRAKDNTEDIIDRLKDGEGFWERVSKKRRTWIASWVSKIVVGEGEEEPGEYQFLPEQSTVQPEGTKSNLRRQIEDLGVVGGIANRIRGVADDYIRDKLDEIERRIDEKLEEIDRRLAEWRDREVANRLRILRITLFFTVLVAVLSLGYNYIKNNVSINEESSPPAAAPAK